MDYRRRQLLTKATPAQTVDFYKPGTKRLKKGFRYAEGGIYEAATGKVHQLP